MRDLYFGYGVSGYGISKILNEMGLKGKLGGIWRSSTVIRTIKYEFHENRDNAEFTKPIWWSNATFTDLVPWTTKSCLNLYPSKSEPPKMPSPYPSSFGKTVPQKTQTTRHFPRRPSGSATARARRPVKRSPSSSRSGSVPPSFGWISPTGFLSRRGRRVSRISARAFWVVRRVARFRLETKHR